MQKKIWKFVPVALFVTSLIVFCSSKLAAEQTVWAEPIPVTDDWITISKARDVGDFRLFRRYGLLLNDQSQLVPNLFILNCAHLPSKHYSYLAIILPKHYPIASFQREDWLPHLSVRFVIDGDLSLTMDGEYRGGEIDFDFAPHQSEAFLKVIRAKNLAIGFGNNDILRFLINAKVTATFTDLVRKGDYEATMGQITQYTTEQVERACPLTISPATAASDEASEVRVSLVNVGGTFVVPVVINDAISLDFTVDSGAADVTVPIDVFSTLVRAGTITKGDISGSQTYVTATGDKAALPTFTIRSLRVGGITIHNVSGVVVPVQGTLLLGQSFLRRFRSWSIDNSRHELLLR